MQNFHFLCVFDMYAYVLTNVCTRMWRPEVGVWCFPQSLSLSPLICLLIIHLFVEVWFHLTWSLPFQQADGPGVSTLTSSSQVCSACIPPGPRLQGCQIQTLVLPSSPDAVQPVPSTLSHLPAHLLFLEALKLGDVFSGFCMVCL